MKDYYDILQVSPNAEQEVIEVAYRRLARKYHPDVYSGPDAADRMRELNEAYEVLSGPRRRAEYDAALGRAQARAGARRPQEERAPPPPPPPPTEQPKGPESSTPEGSSPRRRRLQPVWLGLAAGVVLTLLVAAGSTAAVLITRPHEPRNPTSALGPTARAQVTGLELTDECVAVLGRLSAGELGRVHDCYYFGTTDPFKLLSTLDTCEELEAFVDHPTDLHRGQALTAVWLSKYYDECSHELPEPFAWDSVGQWLAATRAERERFCSDYPDLASLSGCMATGQKTW